MISEPRVELRFVLRDDRGLEPEALLVTDLAGALLGEDAVKALG